MSARELGAYHIAATIGCSVHELKKNITYKEYLGWIEYFNEINGQQEKPNPLNDDSGSTLLQEFGL